MPTITLRPRLEDSGSGTEPIVTAGWMYRVRNSVDYVDGNGDLVVAEWPAGGGWKAFNGASATLDLDARPPEEPYYLELRGPADPSSSPRLPVYRREYRQVLNSTSNGTSWYALNRVSGPGVGTPDFQPGGFVELDARIDSLEEQIEDIVVTGGSTTTLSTIPGMSTDARAFNAAANYLAMRNLLLTAGTTTVDDLTVSDDATVTGDLTVSGAVTVPDGSIAQAKVVNLVSNLAAKAPLASPALTGVPTVPTATAGTNTTQAASTAFVQTAVSGVTAGAVAFANVTGVPADNAALDAAFDAAAADTATAQAAADAAQVTADAAVPSADLGGIISDALSNYVSTSVFTSSMANVAFVLPYGSGWPVSRPAGAGTRVLIALGGPAAPSWLSTTYNDVWLGTV